MEDISTQVTLLPVAEVEHEMQIRDFVEKRTKKPLLKGAAFYQLIKSEDKVQGYKKIVAVAADYAFGVAVKAAFGPARRSSTAPAEATSATTRPQVVDRTIRASGPNDGYEVQPP